MKYIKTGNDLSILIERIDEIEKEVISRRKINKKGFSILFKKKIKLVLNNFQFDNNRNTIPKLSEKP